MRKSILILTTLFAVSAFGAESPIDRWARAAGGLDKIAAIKSISREGTLDVGAFSGTIKVRHTPDGRYRKEEQVAMFSSIESCDGTDVTVQKNGAAPQKLTGDELSLERSKAFANSNAMFFVFFPKTHRGAVSTEGDNTIVFTPEGGVEWRIVLDPQTSLPATMSHKEGERTITVNFTAYETVDGVTLEKEIRRTADQGPGAVIRFSKTTIEKR